MDRFGPGMDVERAFVDVAGNARERHRAAPASNSGAGSAIFGAHPGGGRITTRSCFTRVVAANPHSGA